MVGVSLKDLPLPPAPAAGAAGSRVNQTMVGMPSNLLPLDAVPMPLGHPAPAVRSAAPMPLNREAPAAAPSKGSNAHVDAATRPLGSVPALLNERKGTPSLPHPAAATLLGVARPGIAPLAPGVAAEPDEPEPPRGTANPPGYAAMRELGVTMGPAAGLPWAKPLPQPKLGSPAMRDMRRRRHLPAAMIPPKRRQAISKRALAVIFAALGLALAAALVALFWPSAPPLTARARADADGRDGVELRCKSCPDGTRVSVGAASATMTGGTALVPLPTALSVGENRMKVAIDRPARGRDETVGVMLNVAYRIRPDLSSLEAERPAIQIIAEAASGTRISVDGKPMQLSGGRAVESIDVTLACTGLSGELKSLTQQIPYTVTTESGPPEQGLINVSVGIVPLQLEAPGPHVIIDGPSFVLAGRTMKGAEVLAAGRPITVRPDGTFAQVMNVSSVGATQIEVRAKITGLAPRLSQIKVRRVDNLETAAREFLSDAPISYAPLSQNLTGQIGKPITVTGNVLEARTQGHETVMLLDVAQSSGCPSAGTCTVRLVQGAENPAKKGDTLRVFGHVSQAFSVPGRADIPEIEVDFTLKGQK
jgi:hypothetical protein